MQSIIAVSGFGGAGKSTFSDLLGTITDIPVIRLDSFARDRLENNPVMWDSMDFDRLEKEVLIPFSSGAGHITYGNYHWGENRITKTNTIENKGKLILEGVGLLRPSINKYFSYKIWVDVPKDEAVRRGKKRDREVHNVDRDENWDGIWMRNDTEYFDTFKPKWQTSFLLTTSRNSSSNILHPAEPRKQKSPLGFFCFRTSLLTRQATIDRCCISLYIGFQVERCRSSNASSTGGEKNENYRKTSTGRKRAAPACTRLLS